MTQYNGFERLDSIYVMARIMRQHRLWHSREQVQTDLKMHAAVNAAVLVCPPDDQHRLILEWPHIADDDKRQIAYTRDARAGEENRQVMTSIGKYLRRHFSRMTDHVLRDIVALHTPNNVEFKFLRTVAEMCDAVDNGPYSCMCNRYTSDPDRWTDPDNITKGHHPYEAYDPELGWHMAVAMEGDQITGRALCYGEMYVRTYKWVSPNSSTTDERLDAWLQEQGYAKEVGWGYGTAFKHIPLNHHRYAFVAPYIDGYHNNVVIKGDKLVLVAEDDLDDGDVYYECRNTQGVPTRQEVSRGVTCEDCGESVAEDDAHYVGRCEDRCVCDSCRDDNYTYAYTRRGCTAYIDSDDVVEVDGEYYDTTCLSDNNIVRLADGDCTHVDNAIYVGRRGEWYLIDDCTYCEHSGEHEVSDDCVRLHDGEFAHEDDAWLCEHSGEYYLNDTEGIRYETECGKTVHIDYADEYAPTTEAEGE